MSETHSRGTLPQVTLGALAWGFLKIALASFGGGLSAWVRYVVVEQRRWMNDQQFLSGLALARSFPGPNQVNMAMYIGYHLRGLPGAGASMAGLLLVPLAMHLALGFAYFRYHEIPAVDSILNGVVAAVAGMALSLGVKVFGSYWRKPDAVIFATVSFVTVGILHWPLVLVVLILTPISVAWFWPRDDDGQEGEH